MYSPASVKPLSKAQLHKLLKGKPVRVMAGQGMKLHLSKPQHKKLSAAHKKGCGMNLQFDPYQCQMHAKGGGFFEDLLDGLTNAGKTVLNIAPDIAAMAGVPELAAPIKYLTDKYVNDTTGEAEKSRARAEAAKKPAVQPAPFVADLPAVPRRKRLPPLPAVPKKGGNIMEDFGNLAGPWLEKTLRENNLGQEKDPLAFLYGGKSVGLGLKKKASKKKGGTIKEDILAEYNKIPPQYQSGLESLGMAAAKDLGFGVKRKMSEAQKAALAKGRAALAAKRGGALVHPKHGKAKHKKMSGSALYPAGYKGAALMPAGY